jgi:hypothetical protein
MIEELKCQFEKIPPLRGVRGDVKLLLIRQKTKLKNCKKLKELKYIYGLMDKHRGQVPRNCNSA